MAKGELGGLPRRLVWGLFAVLVLIVSSFLVFWVDLEWSVAIHVYQLKAGLDWFAITYYHNYIFVFGALFSILLINPRVGRSELWSIITSIRRAFSSPLDRITVQASSTHVASSRGKYLWFLWQFAKWGTGFLFFIVTRGNLIFAGNVMNPIIMASMGIGSWSDIGRIFALPLSPASGTELVALMPSLEVEYRIFFVTALVFLAVFAIRIILRSFANFGVNAPIEWVRNLFLAAAAVVLAIIFGAPYWLMNVETPYVYGTVWTLFIILMFIWWYLRAFGLKALEKRNFKSTVYKLAALLLGIILIVQLGAIASFSLNWNNNYLSYEWAPQTQKSITVTRWASGLDSIQVGSVLNLPTSNSSTILGLVRQWDQQAASVTMTKEIGAYNWMGLSSSEIVFLNNTEYWVSPTTSSFPATDWISEHLIYTHAARIIVINTHTGEEVSTEQAFNVSSEPLIYYGEPATSGTGGFNGDVYVHVSGYDEIQNVSYSGTPDYTLDGWQKTMWFTFHEAQFGFAFSNYPVDMLWNRDIFNRVGDVLIPGLVVDPAAYLASDGQNLYYVAQIYIDYPLQSGFAASPFLRFFGVVLVNVADGSMKGYTVSNLIGSNSSDFLTSFYDRYYSSWQQAPSWLVPQLRYPEQLLGSPGVAGQLDYDFLYHVSDPFVWRSGSQFYERPSGNTVQYLPWAIGGTTYFVGMQLAEFKSAASKNLAGVYIAYGGDKLGQIDLYQNPSVSTTFIGPAAAENALTTNSQVRTQLTLLPNYRFGSYLLYSVGGRLSYFVAVYTNPGTQGVVTQLPFMTAVEPTNVTVGIGPDAASAYYNQLGASQTITPENNTNTLISAITTLAESENYTIVNATTVNPTIWIQINEVSLSSAGMNTALADMANFLEKYGPGSVANTLYIWTDNSNNLNLGMIKLQGNTITELYYFTIKP